MTQNSFINILVAEDNDLSRELMSSILRSQGYQVYGAVDGESAIKVIEDRDIDFALVDINMAPKGGFDFIKYLVVRGLDIPVAIITSDESSHILMEATALGVSKVIQKPADPQKLIEIVQRILKRRGLQVQPIAVEVKDTKFSAQDLMEKAIALADRNARSKRGGPFGAVVADKDGRILGEGVNGLASRADPTAHAEVMAIRQAAEKLTATDLSECVLYCSSEPTMMGKALIESVGIQKVFYGLSREETKTLDTKPNIKPDYKQLLRNEASVTLQDYLKKTK